MAKKTRRTANQNPNPAPDEKAPVSQVKPEPTPPAEDQEPKRHDSSKCPSCGEWGCPAKNGVRKQGFRRVRRRQCTSCGHRFATWQHIDGGAENVAP